MARGYQRSGHPLEQIKNNVNSPSSCIRRHEIVGRHPRQRDIKKPAAKFFARAHRIFNDEPMPVICPTCQISIFNEKETKKISQIETASEKSATEMKKPAADLPARAV